MTHSYVTTIDLKCKDTLLSELERRECEITKPPYTFFSAKKKGMTCTLYTSGKLVIQGKETEEFVQFYLEPYILQNFAFSYPLAHMNLTPHIGIDESGKGDFFGPLCIAGVFVDENQFEKLISLGIKDSKTLSDQKIAVLAKEIQNHCLHHIVKINPLKYNEIYPGFKNLNNLLAWGHATTIEHLVEKSHCKIVIVDQFAYPHVVERALERKKISISLTQRHRAEEDIAVAAASILARHTFVQGLHALGQELGIPLPKGGGQATISTGKEIVRRWGKEKLREICKMHFKNLDSIISKV